jgi:hypothetical protein
MQKHTKDSDSDTYVHLLLKYFLKTKFFPSWKFFFFLINILNNEIIL